MLRVYSCLCAPDHFWGLEGLCAVLGIKLVVHVERTCLPLCYLVPHLNHVFLFLMFLGHHTWWCPGLILGSALSRPFGLLGWDPCWPQSKYPPCCAISPAPITHIFNCLLDIRDIQGWCQTQSWFLPTNSAPELPSATQDNLSPRNRALFFSQMPPVSLCSHPETFHLD